MKTIEMKMTKAEAAEEIANHIRQFGNSDSMPITIGLMDSGEVDFRHNVHGLGGMAVAVHDTAENDSLGGDYGPEEWTDEDESAYAAMFTDAWIDEAIDRQNDSEDWNDSSVQIVWPTN